MKWRHYLENKSSLFSSLRFEVENKLKYKPFIQREFFKRKISWDFLLSLNIESTNDCNFNCLMCPRGKTNRGFGRISFPLYQRIIDQIKAEKRRLYTLTLIKDGEPLLHPRLAEMILYAKEKNVAHRVEIFTNGSLLDEKKGQALIKSGLDVLNVSINAFHPHTHRKITGTKTYGKVTQNLKNFMVLKEKMKAKKPLAVAKAIQMPGMGEELVKFKNQWERVADQVIISPYHNYGGGATGSSESSRYPCLVLWFNPVVNFDGEVTTCCANYLRNELMMGDIKSQTLGEIWQSDKYKKLRRDHLLGNLDDWPTCRSCNYWQTFVNLEKWLTKKEGIV